MGSRNAESDESGGQAQPLHIVMAGNPGVGKSSILNCIIGEARFQAGISFGKGLTTVLDTVKVGDVLYSDTPGLEDEELRAQAADEISRALQDGGSFKLIFVVTLEAGRIKPADKATINHILEAVENIGIETKYRYSVLVNKCDPGVMRGLQNIKNRAHIEMGFGVGTTLNHIAYMPLDEGAIGEDDIVMPDSSKYKEFIEVAPILNLPPDNNLEVQPDGYNDHVRQLMAELKRLREKIEAVTPVYLPTVAGYADLLDEIEELPAQFITSLELASTRLVDLKTKLNELQALRESYWGRQAANAITAAPAAVFTFGLNLLVQGPAALHQRNRLKQIVKVMRSVIQQINKLRNTYASEPEWASAESQLEIDADVFTNGIDLSELPGGL